MNKRNLILLICLLSLSTAVGCGQGATSQPTLTQPTSTPIPGWEKFEHGGVELWLPERYEGGNLAVDYDSVADGLRGLGPEGEQMAHNLDPSMFILWMFDSEVEDLEFLTVVNVAT